MIIYYTDGSASPNPGPGGFAVIKNGAPHILGSEEGETTNFGLMLSPNGHRAGKQRAGRRRAAKLKTSTSYKKYTRSTSSQTRF
jgi:hypothetical protein